MRLSVRIAGGLVLLAAFSVAAPGYVLWRGLEARMDEVRALEADRLSLSLQALRAELDRTVGDGLARAGREASMRSTLLVEVFAPPGRGGTSATRPDRGTEMKLAAPELMARAGLDLLWLTDAEGFILGCGHWPARQGGAAPTLSSRAGGRPWFTVERVRNESWPTLQAVERVELSGGGAERVLFVGGGVRLDRALAGWANGGSVDGVGHQFLGLADSHGGLLAAWPGPFPVRDLPASLLTTIQRGEGGRAEVVDSAGAEHLLVALPLGGEGPARGSLIGARDLSTLQSWRSSLLRALAGAGAAVLLLATLGGVLLGRRLARPIDDLTHVAGSIAAGNFDLTLPAQGTDEVGRLTGAFNAMAESIRAGRRELARTERLAAWRDAARRMAHEVKNPLAPIRMSVENLKRARSTSPEAFAGLFEAECRTILEEVDALRRLVDEFARFARLPEPDRRPTDPTTLVRRAADLLSASLDGIDLERRIDGALPRLDVDPDLITQVLRNLLANARDAVPRPGGRIVLECRGRGQEVVFSVADNGPGIPAEVRERLFEPQLTTKTAGSGLGLAISRQIVERHGGRIEVETGERGTVFTVVLPVVAEAS